MEYNPDIQLRPTLDIEVYLYTSDDLYKYVLKNEKNIKNPIIQHQIDVFKMLRLFRDNSYRVVI